MRVFDDDDVLWACRRCPTFDLDGPREHFAIMAIRCPGGLSEWRQVRFGDLNPQERGIARRELTPCGCSAPGGIGRSCDRTAGHPPPHGVGVAFARRAPVRMVWRDGDDELTPANPEPPTLPMLRAMEVLAVVGPVPRRAPPRGIGGALDGLEARGLVLTDAAGLCRLSRHGLDVLIEAPPLGFVQESAR